MSEKNSGFSKIIFLVFTSFLLGIIFSQYIEKNPRSNLWTTWVKHDKSLEETSRNDLDFSNFWKTYDILKQEYFLAENVSKSDIETGIIQGLVESLWDPHSDFLDPETNKKFQEVLSGDFEWIGAVVEKVPLWVQVERLIKWSPAKQAGIISGDIIIAVNGEDIDKLDLYDAVEKIKGDAGTQALLKIFRAGESDFLEIPVIRDKIQIPSVEWEVLDGDIWYIAINLYGETTTEEFKKTLQEIQDQDIQGLILDVRDNGGGYLQSAVEILSGFIEDGQVLVETRYRDSFFDRKFYSSNSEVFDKKIVVLINRNSASASEITAWALREYDKAILVGEKSYGKWSVQQPFDIDGGSLLKLTIAHWFTPKGKSIEEEGINPDIEVVFQDEDFENDYDRQLEEAKKILESFKKVGSIQLAIDRYNSLQEQEVQE